MGWTLAVDFGTSATAAAVHDGSTELLEVDGSPRLPSLVMIGSDGEVVVGAAAMRQALLSPERVERTPKRRLGDPVVVLGDQAFPPAELVAAVLRHVAAEATRHQGGTQPEQVVLTHPVSWVGARLAALREAARLAGLGDVTLVPEPVAAALHLGDQIELGAHVAVYDLGGGTFDAAVLRRTTTGFEPVGVPGGDERLGGEDFDELLYDEIGQRIAAQHPDVWRHLTTSDERAWMRANAALRDEARAAKEALSSSPEYTAYVGAPADVEVTVSRERFEELIREPVERTVDELVATVERAGLTMADIAAVHLVGGSSRVPLVTRLLSERTGLVPTTWGDPKAAVALGAAARAAAPSPVVLVAPEAGEPTAVTEVVAADAEPTDETTLAPVAAPDGRRWRVPALIAAVVAVLALVGLGLVFAGGDDDAPTEVDLAGADDGTTTSTTEEQPEVETEESGELTVDFPEVAGDGRATTRSWRYDPANGALVNELRLTNSTDQPAEVTHLEVIPKEVAADVSAVEFSPAYSSVVLADPVVSYELTLGAGESVDLTWTAQIDGDLDADALGALADARNTEETAFFERLAGLADELARQEDDPGTTEPTGSSTTTDTRQSGTTSSSTSSSSTTSSTTQSTTTISTPGAVGTFVSKDAVATDPDGDNVRVTLTWTPPGDDGGQAPTGYTVRCTVMVNTSSSGSCGQFSASGSARSTSVTVAKPGAALSWVKWELAAQNSKGTGPYSVATVQVPNVVSQYSWVAYGVTRVAGLKAGGAAPVECGMEQYRICTQSRTAGNTVASGSTISLAEQQ